MQQVFSGRMSTRGGAFVIGVGAALLAAILLIVYLNRYRNSVNAGAKSAPVLVAKGLIAKGTSGSVIAQQELFRTVSIAHSDIKTGAITDPAYLNGRIAVTDIFPGQQITTADVSAGLTDSLTSQLTGTEARVALRVGRLADSSASLMKATTPTSTTRLAPAAETRSGCSRRTSRCSALRRKTLLVLKADALLAEKLAVASGFRTLWFPFGRLRAPCDAEEGRYEPGASSPDRVER